MSAKHHPSIDIVRQSFREENGRIFWLERPRHHFPSYKAWKTFNAKFAGTEAGTLTMGRCQIGLNSQKFFRARYVWAIHKGEWRIGIDHINQDKLDDRIENLRPANQSQNMANRGHNKRNTSGYKGVNWHSRMQKWRATISVNRKKTYLGLFDDPVKAHEAYLAAAREAWGEFACG